MRYRDLPEDGPEVWRSVARGTAVLLAAATGVCLAVVAVGVSTGGLDLDRLLFRDRAVDAEIIDRTDTGERCGRTGNASWSRYLVRWTTPAGEQAEAYVHSCPGSSSGGTHPVRVTPAQERAAAQGLRPSVPKSSIVLTYGFYGGSGLAIVVLVAWLRTRPATRRARREERIRAALRHASLSHQRAQAVDERRGGPADQA
ncbi:hypothetical protein ABFT23_19495 [Nocardioides sp. C4-1]|uniref:hypothetical protein n=1 Tax=Nocardioides sp. C4-1 TaxID=3151851 RepID=UPI0032650525